jgi:hypothetical protein
MADEKADKAPLDEFTQIVKRAIGTVDTKNLGDESVNNIVDWLYNNGHGRLDKVKALNASDIRALVSVEANILDRVIARLRMMEPYFFADWVVSIANGFFKDFSQHIVTEQTSTWSNRYARSLSAEELRPFFDEANIFPDFALILHRALHPDSEGKLSFAVALFSFRFFLEYADEVRRNARLRRKVFKNWKLGELISYAVTEPGSIMEITYQTLQDTRAYQDGLIDRAKTLVQKK